MLTLRAAVPGDADILSALAGASAAHWGYPRETLVVWEDDLRITPEFVESSTTVCAVDGGDVVGFAAAIVAGDDAKLRHMWVRPDHIGTGVGRVLFAAVVERLGETGVKRLRLVSDPNAAGFYCRMGARQVGEVVDDSVGHTAPVFEFEVPATVGRPST